MRDAQHLRAQAEFCLEVANQISDHKTVEKLQAEAARYRAEAAAMEAARQPGSPSIAHAVWNSTSLAFQLTGDDVMRINSVTLYSLPYVVAVASFSCAHEVAPSANWIDLWTQTRKPSIFWLNCELFS